MGYLVRKFKDVTYKNMIADAKSKKHILPDVLVEFKTFGTGTLSTWRIDRLEDLNKAILPLALSVENIAEINVIIIDEKLLKKYRLKKKQESSEQTNLINNSKLDKLHCNIQNVTTWNIRKCVALYKDTMDKDPDLNIYVRKILVDDVAKLIIDSYKQGLITQDNIKCLKKLKSTYGNFITQAGITFN